MAAVIYMFISVMYLPSFSFIDNLVISFIGAFLYLSGSNSYSWYLSVCGLLTLG